MKRVLLLLVLSMTGSACNRAPEPEPTPPATTMTIEPGPPTTDDVPARKDEAHKKEPKKDFTFTADQFAIDRDQPWQKNIRVFGRNLITLTGEIRSLGTNTAYLPYVELKVTGSPNGIRCYTVDKKPWNTLLPGQRVSLQGYYPREFGFGHIIQNAKLLDAGPKPEQTIAAEQFIAECAANAEETQRKYKNKNIVLRGKVATFMKDEYNTGTITLAGPSKPTVTIVCPRLDLFYPQAIKPGDTLSFLVEVEAIQAERVQLSNGRILEP